MEENLKNKLAEIAKDAVINKVLLPSDFCREYSKEFEIKRKKLPRKLKKQYKKENKYCFEVNYIDSMEYASITIPII